MRTTVLIAVAVLLASSTGVVADPVEARFYVGFEDRDARDYDYNDFGMLVSVVEAREAERLVALDLLFEARCHVAGDFHDVHMTRRFAPEVRYAYTVDRSRGAEGSEHQATLGPVFGSGDLDLVVFDSAFTVPGDFVRVRIDLEEPLYVPAFDPAHSPYASEGSWAAYDLWLYDRAVEAERHLSDAQRFRESDVELPFVLVLPAVGFEPPAEGQSISDVYPDFVEYFATGDDELRAWYETDPQR